MRPVGSSGTPPTRISRSIRAEVEAAPEDWRGWYRLAHAYDLSGDRKRARSSMRHAIELANAAGKA